MKLIITGEKARKKLLKGAKIMYDCVATTLGPKGRNVAIARQWHYPIVVHDGVTVAKEVESKDEYIDMGIQLIRESAANTNTEAGDGTTTATLLSYHIIKKGMELLEKGYNPMVLRKQIEETLPLLVKRLEEISTETNSQRDIEYVATVSSSSKRIGKLVAGAIEKVGKDGLITVEEGKSIKTEVEYTEGMEIDKGWKSHLFRTNTEREEAVVHKPAIVIFNKEVSMQKEIVPLLEAIVNKNKNFVIVGKVKGPALEIIVGNKLRGNVNALVIDPPSFGDNQLAILEDLAILTGGKVITDEFLGMDKETFAKEFDINWVGNANSVVAGKDTTKIIKLDDDKIDKAVNTRVKQLRNLKEKEESIFEQEKLDERIAKLTTGAAVIKVGVKNEVEMREKVERVKDAVGSAKSALREGIIPGGGLAFIKMAEALEPSKNEGHALMHSVLYEHPRKLFTNAGEDEKSIEVIFEEISKKEGNYGYEVNTGEIVDLVKAGIVDPTKVIRLGLENAVSVAGTILTTDVLIALKYQFNKDGEG